MACGILVLRSEVELMPPEVEALSPNHWATREVPKILLTCVQLQHMSNFAGMY